MKSSIVSIIIPVYNAERYIERCINSVINQSYREWRLIVINDGSTDGSLMKLSKYMDNKRISIIDIPNGGVVNARRMALKYADGDYLTFLDADDYLPNDAISLMVDKMRNENADLVIGGYTLHWEKDNRLIDVNNIKDFSNPDECLDYCIKYGETFLPVKMYRTDIFKESVSIPSDVIFMEDTIGIMQYLSHCKGVATIGQSVYVYFKNSGSASMTIKSATVLSMMRVVEFIMDYCKEGTCGDKKILMRKCGDLLLKVMDNLPLIPDHKYRFYKLSQHYINNSITTSGYEIRLLKLYRTNPGLALICHSYVTRLSKFKSILRKLIWRVIRR